MTLRRSLARLAPPLAPALALLAALALAACQKPPASDYVTGIANPARPVNVVSVGNDASGEACTEQAAGSGADIYCGTWTQPSGRVRRGGAASVETLARLATASPWRLALNTRYLCAAPQSTSILGGAPTELMQCTRRIGGWPHIAIVSLLGGRAWYADGVLPALPVMERTVGVLTGRIAPAEASAAARSAADAMLADRLAQKAFTAGDVGTFDELMALGTRQNLAENFAASAHAFRGALLLQQKILGAQNPNTVLPMVYLALELSDLGHYDQAAALFQQAGALAPHAADPAAPARLLHYRALDQLNQDHLSRALALLRRAEAAYAALVPPETLAAQPASAGRGLIVATAGGPSLAAMLSGQDLLIDPATQSALLGVIETRRYQGVILRLQHHFRQSAGAFASAERLAQANGLNEAIITGRIVRSAAVLADARGLVNDATLRFDRAALDFSRALPGTAALAETELLRGAALRRAKDAAGALAACRRGFALLAALNASTRPALVGPCLDALNQAAAAADPAARQAIRAEMFADSQFAVSSLTAAEISQAAAGLAASNPKVAAAIRAQSDARAKLTDLERRRDLLARPSPGQPPASPKVMAALDQQIAAATAAANEAESAVQAADPGFAAFTQQVVPAAAVFAALRPDEAFASILLTPRASYTFLLHAGHIGLARGPVGEPAMDKLVHRLRASIEPTTAGLPAFAMATAYRIWSDTLGGVAHGLAGVRSLVVAPTGPLLSIPFALLPTKPAPATDLAGAPWLIRKVAVAHVPAPATFVALRKSAAGRQAPQAWFGFGDFRPVTLAQAEATFPPATCGDNAQLLAGLPPLPGAIRELSAARAILGATPRDELLGAAFTAADVGRADLARFRILHFATHALLPTDLACENQPAVVTSAPAGAPNASGALLTAAAISKLHLNADLVILSACNTGGPGGAAGESLSGLARAFFRAGARALLVTHWSVNDQAAAYLIALTLNDLRKGTSGGISGSLRAAELSILARAGHGLPAEIAYPFFWAPFAVIGDGGAALPAASAALPLPGAPG